MAHNMINRGVIYCATNHVFFLEAALISAIALRQLNPEIPVTILCDASTYQVLPLEDVGIKLIKVSMEADRNKSLGFVSRNLKTQLAKITPYQETLYIDSDMLPLKSIAQIWNYLSEADLAMVHDELPTIAQCDHIAKEELDYTMGILPGSTLQFNCGFMLWRNNEKTQALFDQWQQEWQCFQKHDQLAMVRALATTQLNVAELPVNYNISLIDAEPFLLPKNEVYFLHCWGGQVTSGEYRRIAKQFYPHIVDRVDALLAVRLKRAFLVARLKKIYLRFRELLLACRWVTRNRHT
jgi:Nucleotide-diphospho-sugar transferase